MFYGPHRHESIGAGQSVIKLQLYENLPYSRQVFCARFPVQRKKSDLFLQCFLGCGKIRKKVPALDAEWFMQTEQNVFHKEKGGEQYF